jgi:transposase-like protein
MVHSFSMKEELMDHAVIEFRKAAARENRGRHGLRRRYSRALQHRAVEYWRMRRLNGDSVRVVATALGVAHWSLHRWIEAAKRDPRFQPVKVVIPEPARPTTPIVIDLLTVGARVEGLDVEAAAKLLALLR